MATEWLRSGNDVHILSMGSDSLAACSMLYHLLLQIVNTQLTSVISPGQPHLLQYSFCVKDAVDKALNDFLLSARRGSLYVIADEAERQPSADFLFDDERSDYLQTFCDKLLTQVPRLHLWGASCYHGDAPAGWHVECLTRPLRSPPAVVREVQQDKAMTERRDVLAYSERGVADHTDGLPVRRLYHQGQGHFCNWSGDCVTCCRELASFLHSLRVPVTSTSVNPISSRTTPPCLQWRDVLVLYWNNVKRKTRVVTALTEAGIPAQVMTDDDLEDVVTARSDVVWVAQGVWVRGLERKVVVCMQPDSVDLSYVRLHNMSRCTSQLVIVSP